MLGRLFRSSRPLAILLVAALGLSGCLTPRVKPTVSQAVLDARARQAAPPVTACPDLTSPLSVGFGFGEAAISDLAAPAVTDAAEILACHPKVAAIIVGQADAHGTAADQRSLAQARAEAVAQQLAARGVAAARLRTQAQGTAPAGDAATLVILAEGRRW